MNILGIEAFIPLLIISEKWRKKKLETWEKARAVLGGSPPPLLAIYKNDGLLNIFLLLYLSLDILVLFHRILLVKVLHKISNLKLSQGILFYESFTIKYFDLNRKSKKCL